MPNRQQRVLGRQIMRAGLMLVVLVSGLAECLALWRARWHQQAQQSVRV